MSNLSPTSVVVALSATKAASMEAVGNLHALHYHWEKLSELERNRSFERAKEAIERAFVAILTAERDMAPAAISEPSNVVQIGDHSPEYSRTLDTVAEIVGAPQFDGAAA